MEKTVMFKPPLPCALILLTLSGLALPSAGFAQQPTDSELTLEMLQRIEQLEVEVRRLRGELELQRHQLDLRQTERNAAIPAPASAGVNQAPPGGYSSPPPPAVAPPAASAPPPPAAPPLAAPPPPAAVGGTESADFDAALSELREGRYPQAIADLQRFVSAWPNSSRVGDAQYWLGEAYYLSRNYDAAKEAFINLGLHYPQNARLPDALLKLGYIYGEQGDAARARDVLQKLVQVYPNSQAASLAERRLQSLR